MDEEIKRNFGTIISGILRDLIVFRNKSQHQAQFTASDAQIFLTSAWRLLSYANATDPAEKLKRLEAILYNREEKQKSEEIAAKNAERLHPEERNETSEGVREKAYLNWRDVPVALMHSPLLIRTIANRYECEPFQVGGRIFPATVLWKNTERLIDPQHVLGELDEADTLELTESAVLSPGEYEEARRLVKEEATKGRIKYESVCYRVKRIDASDNPPRIDGGKGRYYDAMLTQTALEWELKKAVSEAGNSWVEKLKRPGRLPLREYAEKMGNPLVHGCGRSALISISTLLVFKTPGDDFRFLLNRRSKDVFVHPGMLHVAPVGMFESKHKYEHWSVEMNVWREMLEEVYDEEEQHGDGRVLMSNIIY